MKIMSSVAVLFVAAALVFPNVVIAANQSASGLKIKSIRAVGNYAGTAFDNTIELWFTTPLAWPEASPCRNTVRVYVDTTNEHIVSAAYFSVSSNKTVRINVDTTLPIRGNACEVSWMDVFS